MTDKVHLSYGRTYRSREASVARRYGAGGDWVKRDNTRIVEDSEGDLATGPLGAFDHASTSGLDVTIDSGEGFVRGAYLARDTQTTVTLAASTANQTVYVGWRDSVPDTVIIGKSGAFGSDDPMMAIWEFSTDATTVSSTADRRPLGYHLDAAQLHLDDQLQHATYGSTGAMPTSEFVEGSAAYDTQTHRPAWYDGSKMRLNADVPVTTNQIADDAVTQAKMSGPPSQLSSYPLTPGVDIPAMAFPSLTNKPLIRASDAGSVTWVSQDNVTRGTGTTTIKTVTGHGYLVQGTVYVLDANAAHVTMTARVDGEPFEIYGLDMPWVLILMPMFEFDSELKLNFWNGMGVSVDTSMHFGILER